MATEKDIRQFFEQNRPPVPDGSEKFMEEFIRQVDLLPVPARLQRSDKEALLSQLQRFEERRRKSDIEAAVFSVLVSAVVCMLFAAVMLFPPAALSGTAFFTMVMSSPYIFLALLFVATTIISFQRSDLFSI